MKIMISILTALLFLSGQSLASEILDFKTAIQRAYERHPDMVEGRSAIKSAQGDLITARSLPNPEVELEFGGFKRNEEGQRKSNLDSIEIRQPLDPIGVGFLRSIVARNEVKINEERLKYTWGAVYTQVWQEYSQVLISGKKLELAEQNLEGMRQFFGKVQGRYEGGHVLKNDIQRAKIELLKSENSLLQAQTLVKTSKARLNLSLGRPIDSDFEIQEQLTEVELNTNFDSIKAQALASRPDLKIARLQLDSARKNVAMEQLSRLPSYFIGLKKSDKEGDKDYLVVLGITLPFWNLNQGEVKKATAQRDLQETRHEAVLNSALLDVYTAFWEAESKQQQLELSKNSLEESHELLRLANTRYGEGKMDFLNYWDQVSAANGAKAGYYEALLNYNQSISRLETSMNGSLRGEEGFHEKP